CVATDTIRISLNEEIQVDAGADTTIYFGDSIQLNTDVSGGQQPYSAYVWNPSNALVDTTVEDPFTLSLTSTTSFIIEVFDNTGCSDIDSVTVFVNPPLFIDAGADSVVFCYNDSIQIGTNTGANGGLSPFNYQWTPTIGLNNGNIPNPIVRNIDTARWYVLTVFDSLQCFAIDSIFVKENDELIVEAGLPDSLCYGEQTCLAANPLGG
ncbi:MAG: hypothetical protein AAFQ92_30190, partial [Bacteroidota bacterium]